MLPIIKIQRHNQLYLIRKLVGETCAFLSNRNSSIASQLPRQPKQKRRNGKWESVIGLEIHAQISSKSKLFSDSKTLYAAPPNTQVSFFDASLPGTLPVLNKRCVEAGILTALALNCTINKVSEFDRKHYFYADLPAGYQITQQRLPLANNGKLDFIVFSPAARIPPYLCTARLHQLQLEQDSGKSLHFDSKGISLIDLNRAGVGLMELVFEADLSNGEEAAALIKELQLIMLKLGTCSCRMEEGAFRVDANISVNRPGEPWGVRTEVKNINSMRFVAKAIEYEVERQMDLLEKGERVVNETRMFDSGQGKTVPMRDKEVVQDYRYMPEPNLPPLRLCDDSDKVPEHLLFHMVNIDELRRQLPCLPSEIRDNLHSKYGLKIDDVIFLVNKDGMLSYFEKVISKEGRDPRLAMKILRFEVTKILNEKKLSFLECPVDPDHVGELVDLLQNEVITNLILRDVLGILFQGANQSPKEIVKMYNWYRIDDEEELRQVCLEVMNKFAKVVNSYRKTGKVRHFNKLMDEVAVFTNNRVHMQKTKEIMMQLLQEKDDE